MRIHLKIVYVHYAFPRSPGFIELLFKTNMIIRNAWRGVVCQESLIDALSRTLS